MEVLLSFLLLGLCMVVKKIHNYTLSYSPFLQSYYYQYTSMIVLKWYNNYNYTITVIIIIIIL